MQCDIHTVWSVNSVGDRNSVSSVTNGRVDKASTVTQYIPVSKLKSNFKPMEEQRKAKKKIEFFRISSSAYLPKENRAESVKMRPVKASLRTIRMNG